MENGEREEVVRLPISQFHTFRNHPFRVLDDEKMEETVKSVKQYGILMRESSVRLIREDMK